MGQVTLTIDGRRITAELHEYALRVAERAGVAIPTLCDHPDLEPYGACRLCLVEITQKSRTKLVTACNFPVEDGVEIRTFSDDIERHRRMVLEILLARCPSVPGLRDLAAKHGVDQPRFTPGDDTCILCGLCTRVCETYATSAISLLGRGDKKRLDVYTDEPPAGCVGCGACAALCPTGHITDSSAPATYEIWNRKFELATCVVRAGECRGCGACEEACPFSVPRVVLKRAGAAVAFIDVNACRGCGVCLAACPSDAIASPRSKRELPALPNGDGPKLLAIACERSNLGGPDAPELPANAAVLQLPCAGGTSPSMLVSALARGFDGVLVLGRHQQTCRLDGAEDHAREVVERAQQLAHLVGLGSARVRFVEPAPGVEGPTAAIEQALASLAPTALRDTMPIDQLADSAEGAMTALGWLSNRPELGPCADDWLADHGLPAAEPGKPVLLAGPVPYLDLLLDEWLAADSLADQLIDALEVLQALGIEAGVSIERYQTEFATLSERHAGSPIFTLCPGCANSAREAGADARSLVELIAERGSEIKNGAPRPTVALPTGDEQLASAAEALGLEHVAIDPHSPLAHRLGITPDEHRALEQRLARADELGAQALLLACPAALAQHLIARREGAWRRSHSKPVLIGEIAAAALRGDEVTP
ncbi:MAG: 4Fe-4S dicluster domain-containing protein [Deltaproteobacteria bacterium]|nr:4Fe-4S dicluster domain-containing protein [Deltaproteobacteria bacterium]